jgi:hypothetical protein
LELNLLTPQQALVKANVGLCDASVRVSDQRLGVKQLLVCPLQLIIIFAKLTDALPVSRDVMLT